MTHKNHEGLRTGSGRRLASFVRSLIAPALLALLAFPNGAVRADELGSKLRQRVEEVLDGRRPLTEVTLDVVGGYTARGSLVVYGSGVGVWNREKQFTLTPDEVKGLLTRLVASGLFEMPERPKPERQVEMNPPVVVRAVGVRVGDLERVVSQNNRVWTLPALEGLVADLFKLCEKAASAGTGAASLTDGLEKVAAGKLAPETIQVVLNIPPVAASGSGQGANGVLAVLDGGKLTWTEQVPGKPGVIVPVTVSTESVQSLAALLAKSGFEKFPVNLYRGGYVDLRSTVLSRVHSIQARKFASLDPSKHSAQQKTLEKIIEAILALGPQGQAVPAGGGR